MFSSLFQLDLSFESSPDPSKLCKSLSLPESNLDIEQKWQIINISNDEIFDLVDDYIYFHPVKSVEDAEGIQTDSSSKSQDINEKAPDINQQADSSDDIDNLDPHTQDTPDSPQDTSSPTSSEDHPILEKSTYQKYLEKKQLEIEQLELQLSQSRSWDQMGESKAKQRKTDILLEKDLEFQAGSKKAPRVTQSMTEKIENMIINRIFHHRFDSPKLPSEELTLDEDKSSDETLQVDIDQASKSLVDVYKEKFDSKYSSSDDGLTTAQRDVVHKMSTLFDAFNALTHFYFVPSAQSESVSIKSNTIQVEDVTPSTLSQAAQKAPEEIQKPNQKSKSAAELSSEEKRRKHRSKKRIIRKQNQLSRHIRSSDKDLNLLFAKNVKMHESAAVSHLKKKKRTSGTTT